MQNCHAEAGKHADRPRGQRDDALDEGASVFSGLACFATLCVDATNESQPSPLQYVELRRDEMLRAAGLLG